MVINISQRERKNKEALFLRHTARLPSSTSQLVLFHHLFCIHLGGGGVSTSVFTSGGVHFCVYFWGVHFRVHFWEGVHFHVHFQGSISGGGSTSLFTSGEGVQFCVHFWVVHFHVHFWGSHVTYPIMLLYTTIECPSASWAKFTWDPSTSVFTSGGLHVTYPIMLLYATIEHPSASWAKFTWEPPTSMFTSGGPM